LRGQGSDTCVAWPACAVVCSFSVDATCIWCALHSLTEALIDVHIAPWALKPAHTHSRSHVVNRHMQCMMHQSRQKPGCIKSYYNVSSVSGQHLADVAIQHCVKHLECLCLNRTRCRRCYASFDRPLLDTVEDKKKKGRKKTGIVPSARLVCHPGLAAVRSLWYLSRAQNTIGNSLSHPVQQHLMLTLL